VEQLLQDSLPAIPKVESDSDESETHKKPKREKVRLSQIEGQKRLKLFVEQNKHLPPGLFQYEKIDFRKQFGAGSNWDSSKALKPSQQVLKACQELQPMVEKSLKRMDKTTVKMSVIANEFKMQFVDMDKFCRTKKLDPANLYV